MEIDSQHGSKRFCYNTPVSLRRDLLFDIGLQTLHRRSDLCNVWRASGLAHACAGQNPGSAVSKKPSQIRGVAETHPTPAASTQHQRNGFRGKAANFTQRKTEYDGASRGNHAAYPLFLFFVKVLSGTSHETGFRGCAAFPFRAEAAAPGRVDAGRRDCK